MTDSHFTAFDLAQGRGDKPTDVTTRIEYAGLVIRESSPGIWHVLDERGFANVMPGATFARSEEEALQLADVFLAVDRDPQKFWHLLRAIQRQTGSVA